MILHIPPTPRAGRKRIVAADDSELAPATKPQPDGTLVKALARAWRWQRMLDEGQFASVRDLAEAERFGLSYVSRILRLMLLAPDIVERILDGRPAPQLAQLMQPFPVAWERQRKHELALPGEAGATRLTRCRRDLNGLRKAGHPGRALWCASSSVRARDRR